MANLNFAEKISELRAARRLVQQSLRNIDDRISFLLKAQEIADIPVVVRFYNVDSESVEDWQSQSPTSILVNGMLPEDQRSLVEIETLQKEKDSGIKHEDAPPSLVSHCQSIMEACEYLADESQGLLHLNGASQEIISAGISKAKKAGNLAATIHGYLKKNPDWEYVSPGIFRWLKSTSMISQVEYSLQPDAVAPVPDQTEEEPDLHERPAQFSYEQRVA